MRRMFHLLLAVTVLMCALHIGEPAQAHDAIDAHSMFEAHDDNADDGTDDQSDGGEPGKAAHASHHHCPIAPDLRAGYAAQESAIDASIPFARPIASLKSLSQAPPVEPPAA